MKAIRVIGVLGILLGLLVVSAAAQTVQSDFDLKDVVDKKITKSTEKLVKQFMKDTKS